MKHPRSDGRIAFFLNFEPNPPTITHQDGIKARIVKGRVQFYKSAALRELEAAYISRLKRFAPAERWNRPVCLMAKWIFCKPKKGAEGFKATRPDLTNMVKTLEDCMTRCGYWRDDALVCREVLEKVWGPTEEKHGILVSVAPLEEFAP